MAGIPQKGVSKLAAQGSPVENESYDKTFLGTVSQVYPNDYSCDVSTQSAGIFRGIQAPGFQDAVGTGGEVFIPHIGQRVELKQPPNGKPYINRFITTTSDTIGRKPADELTPFDSKVPNVSGGGSANYRRGMPGNLVAGDWIRMGDSNQYIGLLSGGVARLQGSGMAYVQCVGAALDTTEIKGRTVHMFSDFGLMSFDRVSGKPTFLFEGGTDQTLETGINKKNWTVHCSIGTQTDKGCEGFRHTEFRSQDGNPIYKNVLQYDGSSTLYHEGQRHETYNAGFVQLVNGTFTRQVQTGNDILQVDAGDRIEYLSGSRKVSTGSNVAYNIMGGYSAIMQGESYVSCSRMVNNASGGIFSLPGSSSAEWNITNGSATFNVGMPPMDYGAAMSSFNVNVLAPTGGVNFISAGTHAQTAALTMDLTAGAQMSLTAGAVMQLSAVGMLDMASNALMQAAAPVITMTADTLAAINAPSVMIGGSNNIATDPAVLYLELMSYLSALTAALDAHVHMILLPVPFTATTPPAAPIHAGMTAMMAPLFASKKVMLGG